MPYFVERFGGVTIQTTSKNSQGYYTTKRLIQHAKLLCPCGRISRIFIYGECVTDVCEAELNIFVTSIQFVACALRENLSNRSSGVQIPRNMCTRFGRYLYSTKCSWIIHRGIPLIYNLMPLSKAASCL